MPAKNRASSSTGRVTPKGTKATRRRDPAPDLGAADRRTGFGWSADAKGRPNASRASAPRSSHHRGQR